MFGSRDDIRILLVFWFQTVRESKEADEVCQGETLSNCRFIVGVESQIPSLAALFSLSGSGFQDLRSPSVYDVFTGKTQLWRRGIFSQGTNSDDGDEMWLVLQVLCLLQIDGAMFDESHCSSQGNKPSQLQS